MPLTAYWLGQSIVAAALPSEAVRVMERYEPPGKWLAEEVRELTADELGNPIDYGSLTSVAEALAVCRSAQLIFWDYPR
jgi:hypothetical protein